MLQMSYTPLNIFLCLLIYYPSSLLPYYSIGIKQEDRVARHLPLSPRCSPMGGKSESPTSSIDSSSHPALSTTSSLSQPRRRDLSTDLRLGLSLSTFSLQSSCSDSRKPRTDWPPIKPLLRSTLVEKANQTFYVKVYMEGIPIGRKLDLLAHCSYDGLIKTLCRMFRATITYPDVDEKLSRKSTYVLTYEDKEGDWMMVGDVPWELFLNTVKRLKITRADKC